MTRNENTIDAWMTNRRASYFAFASFGALFVNMILTIATGNTQMFEFFGPLYRVLLLPVVFCLPAPDWAKFSGWFWIMLDSSLNIGTINGMSPELAHDLRMGAHLGFGVWAVSVAICASGFLRIAGLLVGIVTPAYSFVAPWAPEAILPLTALLLVIYIISCGFRLRRDDAIVAGPNNPDNRR